MVPGGEKKINGEVKWFSPEKGFGFIFSEDGKEVFVNYTDILADGFKTLVKGQKVDFLLGQGERGPQAVKVRII